jgi:hypothetical protein
MYGTQDLHQVLRMQEDLRRDATKARQAARINKQEQPHTGTRRVFGLRLSHA